MKTKKIFSFLLALAMIFNISASAYEYKAEEINQREQAELDQQEQMLADLETKGVNITHVTDSTLLSNIKNPKNGVLTFTIKVPAGQTLYYTVKLVPDKRTGSIDTAVDASYKNTTNSTVTKQITANVKYFSDMYTISASYTTGNSREQTVHECEKTVASRLVTTVYSTKFVWDEANIKRYVAGQKVTVAITIGISVIIDITVTKGLVTPINGAIIAYAMSCGSFSNAGTIADTKTIMTTPIAGYSYQIKFTPKSNGGYSRIMYVYDKQGNIAETVTLSDVSASGITYAVT